MKDKTAEKDLEVNFLPGTFITDQSTGFAGIISGHVVWNTGNVQYSIDPGVDANGELRDSKWLDGEHFVIDDDKSLLVTVAMKAKPKFNFHNNDIVKHCFSVFSGHIMGKIQWLNGCIEYRVISKNLSKDNQFMYETIAEQDLMLVSRGVVTGEVDTGGPSSTSKTHLTSRKG